MGLLGYSGHITYRTLSEFLELLFSLDINVCVFDETVHEIERIFGAWIESFNKNDYSKFNPKTLELLRAKGLDSIALETEKSLIERRIIKMKIAIDSNFKIKECYQCNELVLEDALKKAGLKNDLRHDTKCISRIHNSRENKKIKKFADKFSIFATLNSVLERSVNDFFKYDESYTNSMLLKNGWRQYYG